MPIDKTIKNRPPKKRPGRETPDKGPGVTGRIKLPGSEQELRFYHGDYQTDALANNLGHFVEIYHIPSDTSVAFKAAITNYQDTYTQEWTPTPVFGRMDPIANYSRTSRTVTVGIDVMAANYAEAELNTGKISLLEQMQYPVMDGNYEDGSAHMRGGPLIKIKFLNWISAGDGSGTAKERGLMGYIGGVQFTPKLELGVFQNGNMIYPKGFAVDLSLTVIHEEMLGWKTEKGGQVIPVNNKFPYGTPGISDGNEARSLSEDEIREVLGEDTETPTETQEANAEKMLK